MVKKWLRPGSLRQGSPLKAVLNSFLLKRNRKVEDWWASKITLHPALALKALLSEVLVKDCVGQMELCTLFPVSILRPPPSHLTYTLKCKCLCPATCFQGIAVLLAVVINLLRTNFLKMMVSILVFFPVPGPALPSQPYSRDKAPLNPAPNVPSFSALPPFVSRTQLGLLCIWCNI